MAPRLHVDRWQCRGGWWARPHEPHEMSLDLLSTWFSKLQESSRTFFSFFLFEERRRMYKKDTPEMDPMTADKRIIWRLGCSSWCTAFTYRNNIIPYSSSLYKNIVPHTKDWFYDRGSREDWRGLEEKWTNFLFNHLQSSRDPRSPNQP
jgi:hypothetical protein